MVAPKGLHVVLMAWLLIAGACGPVIPIPPGTPTSEFVLSGTTPGMTFDQFVLDRRSYRAPMLSFDIPAGQHTVGVRYTIRISDPCDPEESLCSSTVTSGSCSGAFSADANQRYRLLIDTRSGTPNATVRLRSTSALYVGQGESEVATLQCQQNRSTSREGAVSVATF